MTSWGTLCSEIPGNNKLGEKGEGKRRKGEEDEGSGHTWRVTVMFLMDWEV